MSGSTISGVSTGYSPSGATGGLIERPTGHIPTGAFIGRVTSVSVGDGTHRVSVATGYHREPVDAKVLMPFVDPKGSGILAGVRKNTLCVVVTSAEGEFFIVGFYSPSPATLYAGVPVHPGDIHLASSGGAVVSVMSSGDIDLRSHELCAISLFQEDQRTVSVDRTAEYKHAAGVVRWEEASEDSADHDKGDTWHATEVRRERGKPVTYDQVEGRVKGGEDGKEELVSRRRVRDDSGKDLLVEELGDDGTITIRHPGGARFRLKADGNVYVEPKDGGKIYINDPNGTAQGAARIGDATEGHDHQTVITRAGPFVASVQVVTNTDKIKDGSSVVKVG